jgi:hypothetical protein
MLFLARRPAIVLRFRQRGETPCVLRLSARAAVIPLQNGIDAAERLIPIPSRRERSGTNHAMDVCHFQNFEMLDPAARELRGGHGLVGTARQYCVFDDRGTTWVHAVASTYCRFCAFIPIQ